MNPTVLIHILLVNSVLVITNAFSASVNNDRVFVGTPSQNNRRVVSSCMTPLSSIATFTPSTTVDEAVSRLLELGISGAPVLEPTTGCIIGIVSSSDFLQKEAGGGILLPITGSMETVEEYVEVAGKICAKRIGDLMTKNPICLGARKSMRDAAVLMAREKLHQLIIVDDDGDGGEKLVGMLTISDVMKDMLNVVKTLPGDDE